MTITWSDYVSSSVLAHNPDNINTWTDTWPIAVTGTVTSFSFTQGSFIPDDIPGSEITGTVPSIMDSYVADPTTPVDTFTVTATTITGGAINLTLVDTGILWGPSIRVGKYNCMATVNGTDYHAVLTIEFIVEGS